MYVKYKIPVFKESWLFKQKGSKQYRIVESRRPILQQRTDMEDGRIIAASYVWKRNALSNCVWDRPQARIIKLKLKSEVHSHFFDE